MKKFVCAVCGYTYAGDVPPTKCPQCMAASSSYMEVNDHANIWADEHRIGISVGIDEDIQEEIKVSFVTECTQAALYLAMARQAERDGYPEVGSAYRHIAFEGMEYTARLAELLGEMFHPDTKKNLEIAFESEKNSCNALKKLAAKSKNLGLDAIHDVSHEMCKDSARHGQSFQGLLKRFFDSK